MTQPHAAQKRILDIIAAARPPDFLSLPLAEARAAFEAGQRAWFATAGEIAETADIDVPGAAGRLRARLFVPEGQGPFGVLVYVHGGGWTFGSIDTHHPITHPLAAFSGRAVLSFDYRLSPEHPFPAPLDDVLAVLDFVRSGGLGSRFDAGRVAIGGDSAGANLALGAMLTLRDAGRPMPETALLFYGCFAPLFDTPSHSRNGDGNYGLSTRQMRWYWANFLGAAADAPPAAAAPLEADLSGLPPLYLNAAGLDPLLDDSLLLSAKLSAAGVQHRFDLWPGVVHGFLRYVRDLPPAVEALQAAGAFLRERG
jgi:acetyl esterase